MSEQKPNPAADADPIGEFSSCHLGIVGQLEQLRGLPALVEAAQQARRRALALVEFFEEAVETHHGDEERELFPAVLRLATAGEEATAAKALVDQLTGEHRSLEAQWAALRQPLKRIARGADATLDAAAVERLVDEYKRHAELEEREFLPLAKAVLQRESNELAALGLSLHIRHQKPPKPGFI